MTKPAGNQKAHSLLLKAVAENKTSHAYFFSGIEGVGKKLHAVNFAMMINCDSPNYRPCMECGNCQKIIKSVHPDLKIISTDKKNIKLDAIKEVQSFALTRPFEGRRKVIIIDDAHKMNLFAANSLLKTLEEPPANSVIILISQHPKHMPATILSRCVKIVFSPLDDSEMEEVLLSVGHERDKILNVIPFSSGSVRQALTYLEKDLYEYINETRDFLNQIERKKFADISSFSERTAQKNLENTFFYIASQLFSLKIKGYFGENDKESYTGLFKYLRFHEITVNFVKLLRYNISKAFLIEAFLLTINKSEEI